MIGLKSYRESPFIDILDFCTKSALIIYTRATFLASFAKMHKHAIVVFALPAY